MYKDKEMAWFADVGNIVKPTNKSNVGLVPRCSAQFSHRDAQVGAQTLKCQICTNLKRTPTVPIIEQYAPVAGRMTEDRKSFTLFLA